MDDDLKPLFDQASLGLASHSMHQQLVGYFHRLASRCNSTEEVSVLLLASEDGDEQEALKTLKTMNRMFSEMLIEWYVAVRTEAAERRATGSAA